MRALFICVILSAAISIAYSALLGRSPASRFADNVADKEADNKRLDLLKRISSLLSELRDGRLNGKVSEVKDWEDEFDEYMDQCWNPSPAPEDEDMCDAWGEALMEGKSQARSQTKTRMQLFVERLLLANSRAKKNGNK